MRAAVFKELKAPLQLEVIPDPTPEAGQVVVDVHRCGICGSDLHMAEDASYHLPQGAIMGHEFAGEVVELGRNTSLIKKGDLVSVIPIRGCGECAECRRGEPAWCQKMLLQGGGYGEFAIAAESQCIVLPSGLSTVDGAIIEPLAVALHGIQLSGIRPGDKIVVIGAGPIGLSVAFWARRLGAARVVVTDLADFQRERALKMGASDFVSGSGDPVTDVDRLLGGKADIVFECVGVPGLIAQAVEHLRPKGSIVILGLCNKPDSFVPFKALSKELRIQTSAFFTRQEYCMALDALDAGAVEPRYLVSDTIELDQVPAVFENLKRRSGQCKVVIRHD